MQTDTVGQREHDALSVSAPPTRENRVLNVNIKVMPELTELHYRVFDSPETHDSYTRLEFVQKYSINMFHLLIKNLYH